MRRAGADVDTEPCLTQAKTGVEHDGGIRIHRRIQRRQECQRRRRACQHAWHDRCDPRPHIGLARIGGQFRGQRQMRALFAEQQLQFRGAVHTAARQTRQIDIRLRRLPGDAKLPIHHRNMRVPHVHGAELCEPASSR